MELISVIVPAYNAEQTIERCLNSILDGSYKEIEVIVVNDGSVDSTAHRVSAIAENDTRVKLINQENTGVAGARNTGLRNATGQYIAWCDSDDWVEPDWLESLYKHILEYDADISICRCQIDGRASVNTGEVEIWDQDTAIKKFLEHKQLNGTLWNKLFRRNHVAGLFFDVALTHWEDTKYIWQVLQTCHKVVRFHLEKYHFSINETSLMNSPCNKGRVSSTLSAWEYIGEQCVTLGQVYCERANTMCAVQSYGLLLAMFRSGYHDARMERRIRGHMRSSFGSALKAIGGTAHKLIYCICMVNSDIGRKLYTLFAG